MPTYIFLNIVLSQNAELDDAEKFFDFFYPQYTSNPMSLFMFNVLKDFMWIRPGTRSTQPRERN